MVFLRIALTVFLLSFALCANATDYRVDYQVAFLPEDGVAAVEIRLTPGKGRPLTLDFSMPEKRYLDVSGDGELERSKDRALWTPPEKGGSLRYRYRIDRKRRNAGYDARITDSWAILRGDQLVPPAFVRSTPGARAVASISFELPEGWTSAQTAYGSGEAPNSFVVTNPARRFVRPTGWIIAGDLGIRRDRVEGMQVVVAAPRGETYRRMDIVSIITATAPEMKRAFGKLPGKLLILGAGDPMWRGGLSGPNSLYMHAGRPMIGEDGTSTLLHELTHTFTRVTGRKGHDWIAEGFAEFYAIHLPLRSGLVSESRFDRTLRSLARRGRDIKHLPASRSTGDRTARAVLLLHALDEELRERSDGERSLDDLTRALMKKRRVSTDEVIRQAEKLLGGDSKVLNSPLLR